MIPIKLGGDCRIRCAWVRGDLGRNGIIHRARPGRVGFRAEIIIGALFFCFYLIIIIIIIILLLLLFPFVPFVDPCGFYFPARGRTSYAS